MVWVLACVAFIAGMNAYFPVLFIRKMDRLLDVLEQIELNTRRYAPGAVQYPES